MKNKVIQGGKVYCFIFVCADVHLSNDMACFVLIKSNEELFENTWGIPKKFKYYKLCDCSDPRAYWNIFIINSVIVSAVSVVICVLLGSMVSYAISRMQWKSQK